MITEYETNRIVNAKLSGQCIHCGGVLPRHLGLCFVWTKQLELQFGDKIESNFSSGMEDIHAHIDAKDMEMMHEE